MLLVSSALSYHSCTYKGDKRVADVTFGDYWGCTDTDPFYNSAGVSVIFVHNDKGAGLLEGVRDLELTETEFEHASRANPMLFRSKEKSPQREVFAEVFADKGAFCCVQKIADGKAAGCWVRGEMVSGVG